MKKKILILGIIALMIVSVMIQSCREGSIYPNLPPKGDSKNLIDSGYYPNTVNSYWKYAVNYTYGFYDTVTIRLSSITIENDGTQILYFDYSSAYNAYQVFEALNDTSVTRQNIFSSMGCEEKMLIPLSVGLRWNNYCYKIKDTNTYPEKQPYESIVESLDSVMVGSTNFLAYKIVFSVTDSTLAPNGIPFVVETQYFVPYIGYVKGEYESSWDPIGRQYYEHTTWELIDYKIVKK